MLTYISCAKTMTQTSVTVPPVVTSPHFLSQVREAAMELAQWKAEELGEKLKVNSKIAAEVALSYRQFFDETPAALSALCAYTGAVFKRIDVRTFTEADWTFAQEHLRIISFLYGLLSPTDLIKNYRLEGNISLDCRGGKNNFHYWKALLTDYFIAQIQAKGGVLLNLASAEMQDLFHWKKLTSAVTVVSPEFVVMKGGKLKTIVIYAKMCRGEMTRFVIKNRIQHPEELLSFQWEGFRYDATLSTPEHPIFVLNE